MVIRHFSLTSRVKDEISRLKATSGDYLDLIGNLVGEKHGSSECWFLDGLNFRKSVSSGCEPYSSITCKSLVLSRLIYSMFYHQSPGCSSSLSHLPVALASFAQGKHASASVRESFSLLLHLFRKF